MAIIKINGGIPLCGDIEVSGSKNAALPILFATIVTRGVSEISGVPDISDVRVALDIIKGFGARVVRQEGRLYIDTRDLLYREPDVSLTERIRASTYILGASLARFGKCSILSFGGCNFADRPIDLHIKAAESFGALAEGGRLSCKKLTAANIFFEKKSVGATANALILASATEGESVIRGHAKEPHIMALADFLRSAGAQITVTEDEIRVKGRELHGGTVRVIGDMIEAGSYLGAALVTGGRVGVAGCDVAEMGAYIAFLTSLGAKIEITEGKITAERGSLGRRTSVCAEPYPAFPTDLQPIAAPILASHKGGEIFDNVFPLRFGYLEQLASFGVRYNRGCGRAEIFPSEIHSAEVVLPDLRGGAACLLCALAARGESRLYSGDMIMRGYERYDEKLCSLGADIILE